MAGTLGVIALFIMIAVIVKVVSENRTKRILIEKGKVDENIKYLCRDTAENRTLSALKWALILIGIGLAIVIGQIVPSHMMEEITIAGMFLFAGIALLIYYFLAARAFKKDSE